MSSIYEKNYKLLVQLGVIKDGTLVHSSARSRSSWFMDLIVEERTLLDGFNGQGCIGVSLGQYFEQNGDLCSDPFMEILVHPEMKMAEAFSFEMSIPPTYEVVYPEAGKVVLKYKSSQNEFLGQWLTNLVKQCHGKKWVSE